MALETRIFNTLDWGQSWRSHKLSTSWFLCDFCACISICC